MCSACDEGLYMYMRIQIRRRSTIRPPPNERRPMIATVASPACPPSARSARAIRPSARESNMPRVVRLDASDETGGCASCHHADTRDIRRCASRASSKQLDPKAPRHYMPAPLARRSTPPCDAARCPPSGARRLATTADDHPRHRALTKRRGHLAVPRRFNRRSERALPPARYVAAPGVRLSSIRSARSARATTALRRADAASACRSSRGSRARSSLRASAGNRDARSSR